MARNGCWGTYVENLYIGGSVDGSADVDALFLAPGQGDTSFADLCEVTVGEEFQVCVQARVRDSLPIPIRVERSTEANVFANCGVLQTV